MKQTIVWLAILGLGESMPYFIISNPKARCVTVTAPHTTKLRIDYEAPDLDLSETKEPNVWVTINAKQLKSPSFNNAKEWNAHFKSQLKVNAPTPTQERITQTKGSVAYETQQNGQVEVCLRASMASSQNPMRFALHIQKESEIHAHEEHEEQLQQQRDATDADRHLTHMELEMKHLMISMKNIIAEADFSKERETHFHHQTLSMHAASMWWPIVQLCVLLLTGFTQANHVVRFLKSKRLI